MDGVQGVKTVNIVIYKNQPASNKRGRKESGAWEMFTTKTFLAKMTSAAHNNWNLRVSCYKKRESVIFHLKSCIAIKKLMIGMRIHDRPVWYSRTRNRGAQFS